MLSFEIFDLSRHLSLPARLPLSLSPSVGVIEVLSSSLYGFLSRVEMVDSLADDDSLDDLDES